jgi:predicted permease
MIDILLPMAALILVGTLWRPLRPMGLDADTTRKSLTGLVYILLLPALVLDVLWQAPLGLDSLRIVLLAAFGIVSATLLATLIFRRDRVPDTTRGALILASGWGNATYLGLPVLEQTFGSGFRSVALHYDLFANTPLLLTLGVWVAQQHGRAGAARSPLAEIARVPALWAAVIAVILNLYQVPAPEGMAKVLNMLGNSVPSLMLLALGMGLRWDLLSLRCLPAILPVVLIQLLITPFILYWASLGVGLEGELRAAVILEAAMPTMVLGMVICDRYQLDTGLFAAATTLSTVLSLLTLPLWYGWLS